MLPWGPRGERPHAGGPRTQGSPLEQPQFPKQEMRLKIHCGFNHRLRRGGKEGLRVRESQQHWEGEKGLVEGSIWGDLCTFYKRSKPQLMGSIKSAWAGDAPGLGSAHLQAGRQGDESEPPRAVCLTTSKEDR